MTKSPCKPGKSVVLYRHKGVYHMGLENRRSGNVSEGSNPSLSANFPADATVSDARISRCSVSVPAVGDGTEVGTRHTPGPWSYRPSEYDDWGTVRTAPDADGLMYHICQARNPAVDHEGYAEYRANGRDPFEANARLIAAAPELLAHLEWAATFLQPLIGGSAQYDAIRATIASARGEQ